MIFLKLIIAVLLVNIYIVDGFYFNCDDNPCQNGKCISLYHDTAYRCECDPGWTGENCDKNEGGVIDNINNQNNNKENNKDDSKKPVPTKPDLDVDIKDDYVPKENPCGGKCMNNGYCDEIKQRCECPHKFTGQFCQFDNHPNTEVFKNIDECESRCSTKEIKVGSQCDYKKSGLRKTCMCQMVSINKDAGYCSPVLDSFKECQSDCKYNTDWAKNETRLCSYFSTSNEPKTCFCFKREGETTWCDESKIYNFATGYQFNLEKLVVKFAPVILIIAAIFFCKRCCKPIYDRVSKNIDESRTVQDPVQDVLPDSVIVVKEEEEIPLQSRESNNPDLDTLSSDSNRTQIIQKQDQV